MSSTGNISTSGYFYTSSSSGIIFEGSTDDDFETNLTVVDPTADRTISLPNVSGTVITTGDTSTITTTMIGDDQITEAKIADDAVGQDQLKSVVNLQILNSSAMIIMESVFVP